MVRVIGGGGVGVRTVKPFAKCKNDNGKECECTGEDFLTQCEVNALLKGVTGETDEPEGDVKSDRPSEDDWAAAMAEVECAGHSGITTRGTTLPKVIEKVERQIACEERTLIMVNDRLMILRSLLDDLRQIAH